MKSKFLKKVLAVVCAVALLPLSGFASFEAKAASDVPEGLLPFTLSDLGVEGLQTQPQEISLGDYANNMDGTLFSVNVKFGLGEMGTDMMMNGVAIGAIAEGAFWFMDYDSKFTTTVDAHAYGGGLAAVDVGVANAITETVLIQISTDFVDNDGDGSEDDAKIGIFMNGHLVKDTYLYWNDGAANLPDTIKFEWDGIEYSSYEVESNYYEVSSFRSESGYTAPEKEGYVFAGWYTDKELTDALGADVKEGRAYAKFVDEDVLQVKYQIPVDYVQGQATDLRLVTTVDSVNYQSVGFTLEVDGVAKPGDYTTKYVYKEIIGYDYDGAEGKIAYKPNEEFCESSQYFMALTLTGVPAEVHTQTITVTPIWTTLDGTTVTGVVRDIVIDSEEEQPEELKQYFTLSDLGVEGLQTQPQEISLGAYAGNLDGKVFSVNVKFGLGEMGTDMMMNGVAIGAIAEGAFWFMDYDNKFTTTNGGHAYGGGLAAADVGVANAITETVLIQISTDFVDNDGDGAKDDAKIGIFMNGHLVKDTYLYWNDGAANLPDTIKFEWDGIEYSSYEVTEEPEQPVELKQYFTLSDLGVEGLQTQPQEISLGAYAGNLDGKVFSVNVKFGLGEMGTDMMMNGVAIGAIAEGAFWFMDYDNKFTTTNGGHAYGGGLAAADVGVANAITETVLIQISTDFVDNDGDGAKDDAKIGIFMNGHLVKDTYLYWNDGAASLPDTIKFEFNGIEYSSYEVTEEPEQPVELKQNFTLSDLGVEGTQTGGQTISLGDYAGNLDGKVFSVNVKFGSPDCEAGLWMNGVGVSPINSAAFWFLDYDGKFATTADIHAYGGGVLGSDLEVADAVNNTVLVQISTDFVDSDSDGEKDDAKIGIFINGHLVKDTYLIWQDGASQLPTSINFAGNNMEYSSYVEGEEEPVELKQNFTLSDLGVEGTQTGSKTISLGDYAGNLDGKVFSVNVKFGSPDCEAGLWMNGVGISPFNGAAFWFLDYDGKFTTTADIHAYGGGLLGSDVEVADAVNGTMLVQISTDFVDSDSDGAKDDAKIGIFINGHLVKDTYLIWQDGASQLPTSINFSGNNMEYSSYGA